MGLDATVNDWKVIAFAMNRFDPSQISIDCLRQRNAVRLPGSTINSPSQRGFDACRNQARRRTGLKKSNIVNFNIEENCERFASA